MVDHHDADNGGDSRVACVVRVFVPRVRDKFAVRGTSSSPNILLLALVIFTFTILLFAIFTFIILLFVIFTILLFAEQTSVGRV